MAAVIVTSTPPRRPVGRPQLQVLEGGRRAARARARSLRPARALPASVYRRRRLGVLLAAVSLVLVGYLAVSTLFASAGSAAATAATHRAPTGAVYVVQPGDTLWSIARSLHPHGDVRALVDRLEARAGGADLQPGQRVSLDGLTS